MRIKDIYAVIDSSTLIAYLAKQGEYNKIKEHFVGSSSKSKQIVLSAVNWGEVYYVLWRRFGKERSEKIMLEIEQLPIYVEHTTGEIIKTATKFKVNYPNLSYADCFSLATAYLYKKPIITCDYGFSVAREVVKVIIIKV